MTRPPTRQEPSSPSLKWVVTLAACAGVAWPSAARADRRSYGETYEAVTAGKDDVDLEFWHTYATDGDVSNGPIGQGHRGMLEVEYGITDRWDIAYYSMFDFAEREDGPRYSGFSGLKFETRYRLALPGEWWVDPVLYLEYQHLTVGDATDKFEAKGIFAKNIKKWNVATNIAVEVERLREDASFKPELEYAVGVSREIGSPALRLGVETFGKLEMEEEEGGESELEARMWVGPAISWAKTMDGKMHGIWFTLAGGRGLTEKSADYYSRFIMGLQF